MRELILFGACLAFGGIIAANPAYFLPMVAGVVLVVGLVSFISWRRDRKARHNYWSEAAGWGDLSKGLRDQWDYSRRDSDEIQ